MNFESILCKKLVGLHFSGHGVPNRKETFGGSFFKNFNHEGDSLVFEDEKCTGEADFISQKELKDYVKYCNAHRLDFVFVASCHSEFAGKIFRDAGAKHVICVAYEYTVED